MTKGVHLTDDQSYILYSDPANQRPGKRVIRRVAMTGHIPVRFTEDMIAAVRVLAAKDGQSVSSWIRHVVATEIERRGPNGICPTCQKRVAK